MNDLVRFLSVYTRQKEKCDTFFKFLIIRSYYKDRFSASAEAVLLIGLTLHQEYKAITLVIEHPILCTGGGDLGHREGRTDIVVAAVGIVDNDPAG